MGFGTNYDDIPQGGNELVPEGDYECIIVNAEIRKTQNGKYKVAFSLVIRNDVDQECKNRYLFVDVWRKREPSPSDEQVEGFNFAQLTKQNVLYHLKHAVELFPDLNAAILTDTRFSAGHYALTTIANHRRQNKAKQRIQGIMYGEANPGFVARGLKEITRICAAPFMSDKDVINFNPWIKDEEQK